MRQEPPPWDEVAQGAQTRAPGRALHSGQGYILDQATAHYIDLHSVGCLMSGAGYALALARVQDALLQPATAAATQAPL